MMPSSVLRCQFCGLPATSVESANGRSTCSGVRTWENDPFLAEIRGIYDEMVFVCEGEYRQIADDI